MLLIELNAWEDELLVGIQVLQEKKQKNQQKEEEENLKKWFSLCANHQYLQTGWRLKWAKLETINVDFFLNF